MRLKRIVLTWGVAEFCVFRVKCSWRKVKLIFNLSSDSCSKRLRSSDHVIDLLRSFAQYLGQSRPRAIQLCQTTQVCNAYPLQGVFFIRTHKKYLPSAIVV